MLLALSPVRLAVMLGAGLLVAARDPHANGAMLALGLFIGGDLVDALLYALAARATGAYAFGAGGRAGPAGAAGECAIGERREAA